MRSSIGSGAHRKLAYAEAVGLDDNDGAGLEVALDPVEVRQYQPGLVRGSATLLATKHDHGGFARSRVGEQLPEVGICRDEDSAVVACPLEDDRIRRASESETSNVDGLVASRSEEPSDVGGQVLVEEEPHALVRSGSSCSWTASAA